MKKKILIIPMLAFVLLIIAGCFAFSIYKYNQGIIKNDPYSEYNKEDFKKRFVTYADFIKRAEGEDSWIDVEKAKLSLKLPKGWSLVAEDFGYVSLKSDDFIPFNNDWTKRPIAANGCWTEVDIKIDRLEEGYQNITAEYLSQEDMIAENDVIDEEIINLGYSKAVRYTTLSKELDGKIVKVRIPNQNITYGFTAYLFGKDKERCEADFNIFLVSLAIKI